MRRQSTQKMYGAFRDGAINSRKKLVQKNSKLAHQLTMAVVGKNRYSICRLAQIQGCLTVSVVRFKKYPSST